MFIRRKFSTVQNNNKNKNNCSIRTEIKVYQLIFSNRLSEFARFLQTNVHTAYSWCVCVRSRRSNAIFKRKLQRKQQQQQKYSVNSNFTCLHKRRKKNHLLFLLGIFDARNYFFKRTVTPLFAFKFRLSFHH